MQSKLSSLTESIVNILIGYSINLVAQCLIFPLFDVDITIKDNLLIGVMFTFISLARSYTIRRFFNKKVTD